MKTILVLIGDWVNNFLDNVRLFPFIEDELGCKIERKSEFIFETHIKNSKIIFQFCFGPINDHVWKERKAIKMKEGKNLPPPIEEISNKKRDINEIYYLGFCGAMKGKTDSFYLPNKFKEVLFKHYTLDHSHVEQIEVKKEIKAKNSLIGKITGKVCSCITSNQVLSLKYTKDGSSEILLNLSKELLKHADVVEMENYEIVQRFKSKYKGSLLYAGDSPLKINHMMGRNAPNPFNRDKFNKTSLKMIKAII